MSLWSDLPAGVRDTGSLDPLRTALEAIDTDGLTPRTVTDVDGTWRVRSVDVDVPALAGVPVDPATGRWGGSGSGTPIELEGTEVTVAYGEHLTAGAADGGWHLDLDVPGVRLLVPVLRGARLTPEGVLRADEATPQVRFVLPRLVLRLMQLAGSDVSFRLRSASTSGDPVDDVYSFVRMVPDHALIGPADTVGFAFRTAVLDLSTLSDPPGLPPGARAVPGEWQGLHLPEVRLFVAPDGLEGLAVSAGVRDLWIGIGEQEGVTGSFGAEVVNQGGQPQVVARFVTPGGRHVAAVPGAAVEVPDQSLFQVDAAGGIAPLRTRITTGGSAVERDRLTVTVPATGAVSLEAVVTDGGGHASPPVTFQARRPDSAEGDPPDLGNPARLRDLTPETGRVVVVRQTGTAVTVRLDPSEAADWTWPGGSAPGATEATVPLAAGATAQVSATRSVLTPVALDCFFLFDRPRPADTPDSWWRNERNTSSAPSPSRAGPHTGTSFTAGARARLADVGSTPLVVDGYASFEVDPTRADRNDNATHRAYNEELSRRRLEACVAILRDLGYAVTPGTAHGHLPARDGTVLDPGGVAPPPGDSSWWRARARSSTTAPRVVRAELTRGPASPPPAERDPAPPATGRPDCFRRLGVEVELIRSTFVRCEIWGEFDIQTSIESTLEQGREPPLGGRGANPADGLCAFRVRLQIATDGGSWEVTGEFRALEADLDGLWEGRSTNPDIDPVVLNSLGTLAVLGPLSAAVAELSPAAGTLVQLGTVALGASDLVRTQVLTLRGAEVVVSDGVIAPDGSTATDRGTQVSVLLDVEVAFWFDLTVIRVPEDRPVRTRYQAVGVRSRWDTGAGRDEYLPVPIFDPTRGYVLDIQPGALIAQPPLDEILSILGVRVSRDNPTYLEVEAGIGVPLGPVTIDTIRVRARLDAAELPQLTKLGASLDIPGTLHGSGSVEITGAGFKATFDLTVVPLSIRAAATLAIETKDGVTGLLIGIEVQFPVPLVLGNSGLGIYGLLGGVGINYGRLEDATARVPALDWVMKQLAPPRKSVMHPDGWTHRSGSYAFAAGLLLGTVEGGFVLHLKGIILIEVPGPRLLLVMQADVLKAPPVLNSTQSATFLAVLDIDFGRGTITLGIVASYQIQAILRIHVPVTAFFDTQHPERWLVDLGTYEDRVTVSVLEVITGSGYLMVHGDGLPQIPGLPQVTSGVAIATGFHLQAVLMGSKPARLYVEVAAGFDAILGFDPFFLGGRIYIRGELMLFVVSIGVSAELTLLVGTRVVAGREEDHPYVHGKVCGKVSFFFFDVEACCELTVGTQPDPDPDPRPLVAGVTLVGRTPALVEGAAAGRSLDGALGEAGEVRDGTGPPAEEVPVVPLDAVPVVRFHDAPDATGLTVLGAAPRGTSGVAGPGAWRRIGERWWAYRVTAVSLTGALTAGQTPSSWWWQTAPGTTGEVPALALLNWLPTPFTGAVALGEVLRTQVDQRWGSVCRPAAPPQEVLWTFVGQALGPAPGGWTLEGVAWPDPPGTRRRTSSAARRLRVSEPWRTGDPTADLLQGSDPAVVVGDAVACPARPASREDPMKHWAVGNGASEPTSWAGPAAMPFATLADLLAGGGDLLDAGGLWHDQAPDPELARLTGCAGAILRAPAQESVDPAPYGTPGDRERVQRVRDEGGWSPDDLADAVLLTAGEELHHLAVLLLVPLERSRPLWVSLRDADGHELDRREVDHADLVGPGNPLPPAWVEAAGPWAAPVELAGRVAAKVADDGPLPEGLTLITFTELPSGTERVVVGWERQEQDWSLQPFHVVAVAGLLAAELRRHDWDTTIVTTDREALETALTQDPDDHALLVPGTTYRLAVTWEHDSQEGEETPTRTPVYADAQTQEFVFATEPATAVPRDLGPWLLDSDPGMGDAGVFCRRPLRVTLATQNVTRLFDAYAHRLEVTVHAASGQHPAPPGGGAPGDPVVIPLEPITGGVLGTISDVAVLNAWDQAVGEVASRQECVAVDGAHRDVDTLTLHYDLEPLTDYLLDVHAVPTSGVGTALRVHRVGFTSSRFDDVAHLASWVAPAPVEHRLVRDLAPLAGLPGRPTGGEWDDAVQRAGLPVPQTPAAPRVEVWWSADPLPQPLAVVVECSEQLVRERVTPARVQGPVDAVDPTHQWWAARPQTWLDLQPASPPPDPAAAASVARSPVVGPGGTRVLVLMAPGSRGRRLTLELVRRPEPLAADPGERVVAVDVTLHRAPWEVSE